MKEIEHNRTEVITNTATSQDFTIKANRKAFRILIDGLYSNKIQSIVRELWSNAFDSHCEAGCPEKPFLVHIPTVLDPVFTVRDFGVSMDHETVMNLYSTVFESTKDTTNEAVGKFGLGSKSPFSYTDTFTVTAVMDGKKRAYSAVIDTDGVPRIHFMGSTDTDEPNGVSVSFPVNTSDVDKFNEAMHTVSVGFDTKPKVIGDSDFGGWPEITPVIYGAGWDIYRPSDLIQVLGGTSFVRMGCVLYKLDLNACKHFPNYMYNLLYNTAFIIDVPIGAVEVSASRESLSYGDNEPTVATVQQAVQNVMDALVGAIQSKVDSQKTVWEAQCAILDARRIDGLSRVVEDTEFTYKGFPVSYYVTLDMRKNTITTISRGAALNKARVPAGYSAAQLRAERKSVFVVEDRTQKRVTHVPARIKKYVKDHPDVLHVNYIVHFGGNESALDMVETLEALDGATFLMIDELDYDEEDKPVRRATPYVQDISDRYNQKIAVTDEFLEEGGYYVKTYRGNPVVPEGAGFPGIVAVTLQKLKKGETIRYVMVPKTLWKRFDNHPKWKPMYEEAKKAIPKNLPENKLRDYYLAKEAASKSLFVFAEQAVAAGVPKESPMHTAAYLGKMARERSDEHSCEEITRIRDLAALMDAIGERDKLRDIEKSAEDYIKSVVDAIYEMYPMLRIIGYVASDRVDIVVDYVHTCHKALDNVNKAADAA